MVPHAGRTQLQADQVSAAAALPVGVAGGVLLGDIFAVDARVPASQREPPADGLRAADERALPLTSAHGSVDAGGGKADRALPLGRRVTAASFRKQRSREIEKALVEQVAARGLLWLGSRALGAGGG
jgi:hypothetical protein